MKNRITIIAIFILTIANAQIVINMSGDDNNYPSDYLSTGQYYIKDVNNYLDNFTGTWEYVNGNEKFQIILTKVIQFHVIHDTTFNYYKDGICIKYKKFYNNILIYESPLDSYPSFETKNGLLLTGAMYDYGRITKTIILPFSDIVWHQGGVPIYPHCNIEKLANQPNKITFKLHSGMEHGHKGYDKETYSGLPIYSIPNDVIMTKIN